jgi:hypothetical protein
MYRVRECVTIGNVAARCVGGGLTAILCFVTVGTSLGDNGSDASPLKNGLLADPRYTASFQVLESRYKYYGRPSNRDSAYAIEKDADCILFLKAMQTSPHVAPPYVYGAWIGLAGPKKYRSFKIDWIGTDHSLPSLEVIGRGGRVVGSMAGMANAGQVAGDDKCWFRGCFLLPILKGEQDAPSFDADEVKISLDVKSLQELEGVRFSQVGDALPHFVPITFWDGVFPTPKPLTGIDPVK